MFNKDDLKSLGETILYVNLLLAILAIIALYDQRAFNEKEDEEEEHWHADIDAKLAAITRRLEKLEDACACISADKGKNSLTNERLYDSIDK